MNNITKPKSLVSIILLIAILFAYCSLNATTSTPSAPVLPSLAEHKQTIYQFLNDLKSIQNRTFQLSQLVVDNHPEDMPDFSKNITSVNYDLDSLRKKILDYLSILPTMSVENRDILLLLAAVNHSKNALFDLNSLSQTTNKVEKIILFEKFFNNRIDSNNSINALENIISKY